jgi:hypothetical protein
VAGSDCWLACNVSVTQLPVFVGLAIAANLRRVVFSVPVTTAAEEVAVNQTLSEALRALEGSSSRFALVKHPAELMPGANNEDSAFHVSCGLSSLSRPTLAAKSGRLRAADLYAVS